MVFYGRGSQLLRGLIFKKKKNEIHQSNVGQFALKHPVIEYSTKNFRSRFLSCFLYIM